MENTSTDAEALYFNWKMGFATGVAATCAIATATLITKTAAKYAFKKIAK